MTNIQSLFIFLFLFIEIGTNISALKFENSHFNTARYHLDARQTLFGRFRSAVLKYPEVGASVSRALSRLESLEDRYHQTFHGDLLICPGQEDTICASRDERDWTTTWKELSRKIYHEDGECDTCLSTAALLQAVACSSIPWETIRDTFILECERSFVDMGLDPVMCNGTVSLQGPHIYCILLEAPGRDVCESVNSCYPPDDRPRPPVRERTPWAIRANRRMHQETGTAEHTDSEMTFRTEDHGYKNVERTHGPRKRDSLVMVVQLSDIHVQPEHAEGSSSQCNADVCCLETSIGNGSARLYGEYQCNIPPRTVQLFLDRVKQARPDFVIYAGDSPPHTMWEETLHSQLNCSYIVTQMMSKSFGNSMKVYPTIGNHEMYPTNLFSLRMPETTMMTEAFTKMWHGLAGLGSEGNLTMSDLAYYTVLVPGRTDLRIISINTNYDWYTENFYNALNQHTAENARHKQWLNDTLQAARAAGDKVILVGHHPIGDSGVLVRTCRWWEEVVNEYRDVIVLHTSGHEHKDSFTLSFNPFTMDAVSVNLVAASTSSKYYVNPSMKVYYLDPYDGYQLVDMESFYLDIKTQDESRGVPPAIKFSYSARKLYRLPDLSPNSWMELVLRFIDDEDLFQIYFENIDSGVAQPDGSCDYECKVQIICNIWFPDVAEAQECMTLAPPPEMQHEKTGNSITSGSPYSGNFSCSLYFGFLLYFILKLV